MSFRARTVPHLRLMRAGGLATGLLCACAALQPRPALADDTSAGVDFPGWRAEPAGSVTVSAASVRLDAGRVLVSMTVSSVGQAALAANFPPFGFMGGQETYPDRQFPELAVSVEGRAVTLGHDFTARSGATDVTGLIRKAALDPYVVAQTPPLIPKANAAAPQMRQLEGAHAVLATPDGLLAQWTVSRRVGLDVPKGSQHLVYRYSGRPAFGLLSGTPASLLQTSCMTVESLQQAIGQALQSRPYAFRIYTIPVSIDGHAPPAVGVDLGAPDGQEHKRVLTAYCGLDGRAARGREGKTGVPARPDSGGAIHILSVSDEGL